MVQMQALYTKGKESKHLFHYHESQAAEPSFHTVPFILKRRSQLTSVVSIDLWVWIVSGSRSWSNTLVSYTDHPIVIENFLFIFSEEDTLTFSFFYCIYLFIYFGFSFAFAFVIQKTSNHRWFFFLIDLYFSFMDWYLTFNLLIGLCRCYMIILPTF